MSFRLGYKYKYETTFGIWGPYKGIMKTDISLDIMPCNSLKVNWYFVGTYCFHLQCRRISRTRNKGGSRSWCLLSSCFFLRLFFDTEDWGNIVTLMECLLMEFGLVIGCTEHLRLAITNNYGTIANSHNLLFTTARENCCLHQRSLLPCSRS
jgi:hypothetical protein